MTTELHQDFPHWTVTHSDTPEGFGSSAKLLLGQKLITVTRTCDGTLFTIEGGYHIDTAEEFLAWVTNRLKWAMTRDQALMLRAALIVRAAQNEMIYRLEIQKEAMTTAARKGDADAQEACRRRGYAY